MTDSASTTSASNGAYNSIATTAKTVVSEMTGFAALNESTSCPTAPEEPTHSCSDSTTSTSQEAEKEEKPIARDDYTEEHERGPSSPSRTSQSQNRIGTETGIPTTAGAGTTLCADDDVVPAAKKEAEMRRNGEAAVGVDFSDQPCPTSDARRPAPSSAPAEGKTDFESREEQLKGSSDVDQTSSDANSNSTAATSTENAGESERKGAGWKSKLKGEAKIMVGKITRNEDKVELGRDIKFGAQA